MLSVTIDTRRPHEPFIIPTSQSREELRDEARTLELVTAIKRVAHTHRVLSADDVWRYLGEEPRSRRDGSYLGPAFRLAYQKGYIKPTGGYVRSTRKAAHGNLIALWYSQLY